MQEKISFRRATTGDWEDVEINVNGALAIAPGDYLKGREVALPDQSQLRVHRVASRTHRSEGYGRIDNEILAGRRLHQLARDGDYPTELACLYGDYDDKVTVADPFTLFEPYRGRPLKQEVARLYPDQQEAAQIGLLTGLCWLSGAGLAHCALNPNNVLWDGEQIQITDFSHATVFGASRTATSGRRDWVPKEKQPGESYGTVTPGDDSWAAGRLIFYIRTQGEELGERKRLAEEGLDQLIGDVFNEPGARPTAAELLRRMGRRDMAPRLQDNVKLRDWQQRFLVVREQKHPGAPVPPDLLVQRSADPGPGVGPGGPSVSAGFPPAPEPGGPSPMPAPIRLDKTEPYPNGHRQVSAPGPQRSRRRRGRR